MRALVLLVIALPLFVACVAQPPTVPVQVLEYPATWTPAPTATASPLPPTATLVVQDTPLPVVTRDPNARLLPSSPRNSVGTWLAISTQLSKILEPLVPRANVLVTDGTVSGARNPRQVLLLSGQADAFSTENALPPQYNGVLVATTDPAKIQAVRKAIHTRLLIVSMPVTGTETLKAIASDVDGVRLENFLTDLSTPRSQFPGETDWKQDVDALAALAASPNLVVLTATRLSTLPGDDSISVDQWLKFAFASFLLGANNSHSFFGFETPVSVQTLDTPMLQVQIGTPLGAALKQNAVYQRRFTGGLVLVNPDTVPHALELSRPYVDLVGNAVPRLNILPHTGVILLNAQ